MRSEAHHIKASKIGGSLYLTIPAPIRGEIEGGQNVKWSEAGGEAYTLDLCDEGTSRTLKVGGTVKVRIPRDVQPLDAEHAGWTLRRQGEKLIAQKVEETGAALREGSLIETAEGMAVILKSGEGLPYVCAYLEREAKKPFLSVTIEGGEWTGQRIDLTQIFMIRERPTEKGYLNKKTMTRIREALSPLF
jgi:hypothetical protein